MRCVINMATVHLVIGCFAVWLHDVLRFRNVVMSALMIFGGKLIPSNLLLFDLKKIVFYTPIPYVHDVPVKLILGTAAKTNLLVQFL